MAREGITREEFDTEAEAIAFVSGLEFMDNDHISAEPPYIEGEIWVVEVTVFA
jgi:hypothetical protein